MPNPPQTEHLALRPFVPTAYQENKREAICSSARHGVYGPTDKVRIEETNDGTNVYLRIARIVKTVVIPPSRDAA